MTVLSAKEAIQIFDELAAMDLPFGYVEEGCYARAHLMCRALEEKGFEVEKAWLIEDRARHMRPAFPNNDAEAPYWAYHVAPSLPVQKPDGEVVKMIFDPSLFDGPAEEDEWAFMADPDPCKVQFKAFGSAPDGFNGDYKIISSPEYTSPETDTKAKDVCDKHWQKLGNITERAVYKSNLRQELSGAGLSSNFTSQSNVTVKTFDPPDIERVRSIPYWERWGEYDDCDY